jgi:exosortase
VTSDVILEPRAAATVPDARAQARWRRPLVVLVAIELVLLFAPTVLWLVDRWTISVWQNAHGMFVPPLAAWLAWQALKGRRDLPVQGSAWGYILLVPALAIHAIDAGMHTQLLSALALLLAIPGLALLLLGTARVRLIAFPLAFLVFSIPIPLGFTEPLQLVLRHIAANATATVLPLFGVSVFMDGTMLHLNGGTVSIGDACSGFSTLYAAVTVAALVAYSAPSWRRGALVMLAAAPIAIVVNLVRVAALTLMVAWGGAWLLSTFVHPLSGMLTFALALPILFWLGEPPKRASKP